MRLLLTRENIKKGVRNPGHATEFLYEEFIEPQFDTIINSYKSFSEMRKNSKYGLVVNWGHEKQNNWPVAVYPFLLRGLIRKFDPVLITTQRSYERHKAKLEYVISFESCSRKAPEITFDQNEHRNVAMFVGHTHDKQPWFPDYIDNHNIDYVISRYHDPFFNHFPEFDRRRFIHIPWSVPEQFVCPPDEVKFHNQDQLHLFGASSGGMYEERRRCMEHEFVSTHDNSGVDKVMTDEEYYRWCRNFDATIAASSFDEKHQFVFAKYFEITAAGSLLFAQDCSDLERLGFDEETAVIFGPGEFEAKARTYLADPQSYLPIRKNGVKLIRDRHTTSQRISTIESMIHN